MKRTGLLILILVSVPLAAGFSLNPDQGKAAVIQISGSIGGSDGIIPSDTISPEEVRSLNEKAMKKGADAIIYEINSGGGAVVASKDIMRELDSLEVPTVCRFRDVAASGAYLVSLGCDRVVADSSSLTGSIGVQASYLEYSGLLDRLGIEYVNITAGRQKDTGSRYRNITGKEKEILEEKTRRVHQDFVSLVRQRRNLTEAQVSEAETGEVFLGSEARELGLVDRLGGRKKAIEAAEKLTDKELKLFNVDADRSLSFLEFFLSSINFDLGTGAISPLKAVY